jgi:nitroreductase
MGKIGRFLRTVLPWKLYKLIANGILIVPSYYNGIIEDAERYFDIALEENPEKDFLLMKKYAHIVDKGLHRPDAQIGHGKSNYNSLVKAIERLKKTVYSQDPTYLWAVEKLRAYESLQNCPDKFKPLEGPACNEINVTYDELFHVIKSRRSNRQFKQEELSDEVIRKIAETANWAPSSCNKQPIKIFSTNNPQLAHECLKCCKGGTGFSDFIPSFWALTANVRGYVWPSEMYLPYVDVCLGAQNMLLAATTLRVSGSVLSWAQKDRCEEAQLRRLLQIPEDCEIVICIVLGYAERTFQTPVRKNV